MTEVTVATLNLKKGELRWSERAPVLLEQLVELRPDVIGFQEVDLRIDQGNWLCQRSNEALAEREAPYTIYHMANPRENAPVEALAIMSRLPVTSHRGFDYLVRNRVAHAVEIEVGARRLAFWNTHFHHAHDASGHELRRRQAFSLLEWIDVAGRDTVTIAVGDFNALPESEPVRLLKERLRSAHEAVHGREPRRTFWTPLAEEVRGDGPPDDLAIDYVFVSSGVQVLEARLAFDRPGSHDPTLYPSDHYGVAAVVAVGAS